MNQVQANRLLRVAQACRESKHPDKFTMEDYFHTCGTPACAFGHYVARRDLQRAFEAVHRADNGALHPGAWRSVTTGKFYRHCERRAHFGISQDEDAELFGVKGCNDAKTPNEAADYIEEFVRRKGYDIVSE